MTGRSCGRRRIVRYVTADRVVRQRAAGELRAAGRTLPGVSHPHLAALPAVEALTAAWPWRSVAARGDTAFLGYFAFAAALVTITFIDLDHRIIPDVISLPGIALGLASHSSRPSQPFDALLGVVVVVDFFSRRHRLPGDPRPGGHGRGDIKLLAMIGAFLGWQSIFVTVMVASIVGSIIGVALMLYRRRTRSSRFPSSFSGLRSAVHFSLGSYPRFLLRRVTGAGRVVRRGAAAALATSRPSRPGTMR